MSYLIIGGTNVLFYYRWDKCQVVEMLVVEMSVALMSVGQKSRHLVSWLNPKVSKLLTLAQSYR